MAKSIVQAMMENGITVGFNSKQLAAFQARTSRIVKSIPNKKKMSGVLLEFNERYFSDETYAGLLNKLRAFHSEVKEACKQAAKDPNYDTEDQKQAYQEALAQISPRRHQNPR